MTYFFPARMASSDKKDEDSWKHPYTTEDLLLIDSCSNVQFGLEALGVNKDPDHQAYWNWRHVVDIKDSIEIGRSFANQLDKPLLVSGWWDKINRAKKVLAELNETNKKELAKKESDSEEGGKK